MGKTLFQWATTLAPFAVSVLVELQSQVGDRHIDLWSLGNVGIGAAVSLVVVLFHVQRTETVRKQSEDSPA